MLNNSLTILVAIDLDAELQSMIIFDTSSIISRASVSRKNRCGYMLFSTKTTNPLLKVQPPSSRQQVDINARALNLEFLPCCLQRRAFDYGDCPVDHPG